MMFNFALACWALAFAAVQAQQEDGPCAGPRTAGELRTQFLDGYDKYNRPSVAQSLENGPTLLSTIPPDTARVQLHILSLNGVNQKRNEYTISVWFRRSWRDFRLAYANVSQGGCFSDDGSVGYTTKLFEDIWKPEFYIDNQAKPSKETASALWIEPDGRVVWSSQMEITVACDMDFEKVPFDIQECFFRVSTFVQDAKGVVLDFFEDLDPVTKASDTDSAAHLGGTTEWEIVGVHGRHAQFDKSALAQSSLVEVVLDLQRNSQYYSDFVVVPAIMFVVIAWAAFFISRSAAPARVTMSMVVFLANINFLSSQLGQLPRLGNDVWLLKFLNLSTWFSFYGILEYVLCNYLGRIEARLNGARKKASENRKANDTDQDGFITKEEIKATGFNRKVDLMILNPRNGRMYLKDEHVDIFSRWGYPIVYGAVFCGLWFTR